MSKDAKHPSSRPDDAGRPEPCFELVGKFLDEELSEDGARRLVQALDRHDILPERIREQFYIHELLKSRIAFPEYYFLGMQPFEMPNPPITPSPSPTYAPARKSARPKTETAVSKAALSLGKWVKKGLAIGVLFLAVGTLFLLGWETFRFRPGRTVVAHLIDARGAVWESPARAPVVGGAIRTETQRLLEGVVVLKLLDGAEFVLEAPSEIEFLSRTKLRLSEGSLNAEVPPQQESLVIATPHLDIKVLGTAFRVDVRDGRSDVNLVRGKLALSSPELGQFQLNETEGFSLKSSGDSERFTALLDKFIPAAKAANRAGELAEKRREEWRAASTALNERKDLLIRFDFEEERLLNQATVGRGRVDGAEPLDCRPAEGRWPGKRALAFDGRSSRIPLTVPGEFDAITLFASIRVDSLDHLYNSVLASDAANSAGGLGRLHWQLVNDGTVRLGVAPRGSRVMQGDASPPVLRPGRYGNWLKLALTIDTRSGRVCHYLNGKRIAGGTLSQEGRLSIGPAHIGFWLPEDDQKTVRTFRGAMDEFMLFNRALGQEEIRKL